MPFEVFRRHQRKLLAISGILAMFGFVISDSLPRLMSTNTQGQDQEVVELYGRTLYQSDLNDLAQQRNRANVLVADLFSMLAPGSMMSRTPFGGLKTRDLVDAMILEHEADRLGIPAGPEVGLEWLKQVVGNRMSRELFEELASRFSNTVSPEQLLADLANQVRLANVRALLGSPMVTPFDVFQSYRNEKERVSAKLVEIPVERFLSKVPAPSASEIQAFYDQYKDVLPDPSRDTPGFKVPRQIQVEILSIDGRALEESIRNSLTDAELRTAYENQKSQFEVPSELPKDLFAGKPELTPPVIQSFEEARPFLTRSLAEEKAQNQILDTFTQIKVEEIDPFTDKYLEALDLREEDERNGQKPSVELPSPTDLKGIADRLKLNHEITPMLSREQAESYGLISGAEVGLTRLSGGRKFAEEFFDSKTGLYEAVELTDILGTRFLARKIKDVPPYVPKLEDVRSQVELAWKLEKARPLAEKAAEQLAAEIRKQKGEIKEPNPEGYRVNIIPPVSRLQPNYIPNPFTAPGATVETPIPEVPNAGEAFRDALFGLREGEVAVAPNQPKTAWYVLGFQRREPASFASLYAPNGDEYLFKRRAIDHAAQELDEEWMGWLRQQAGLKPGWVPPDEATAEADGGSSSDRQS